MSLSPRPILPIRRSDHANAFGCVLASKAGLVQRQLAERHMSAVSPCICAAKLVRYVAQSRVAGTSAAAPAVYFGPSRRRGSRPTAAPRAGIEAALRDQLVMACPCSTIRPSSSTISRSSAAMVESRCAMAMHRLALHQRVELLLDRRLDLRIERRGRLVEDQDRRVLEEHAGDGDALALAARQLDAALADMRVVAAAAPRGRASPWMNSSACACRAAAAISASSALGPAVGDVVADRAVQQRGVLRHHADLLRAGSPASRRRCPARRSGCARPRRRRAAAAG